MEKSNIRKKIIIEYLNQHHKKYELDDLKGKILERGYTQEELDNAIETLKLKDKKSKKFQAVLANKDGENDEGRKPEEQEIKQISETIKDMKKEISNVIVGQEKVVDSLIRAILCDGHILLEGVPGIAKTLAIKALAKVTGCEAKRIQFTVDLLPTDILGLTTYTPKKGFEIIKGPIFANFVIADEINRSPPKCVLGDTPVITETGKIMDIKELIEEHSGERLNERNEEWIKLSKPLKLMALDLRDYKVKPEEVGYMYRQKTNQPYFDIELKSGRKIKTSSVHPFFTLKNGRAEMCKAEDLKEGECVLVPRKLNLTPREELVYDKVLLEESEKVLKEINERKIIYDKIQLLKNSGARKKQIAKELKIPETDGLLNTFIRLKPSYFNFLNEKRFFSRSKQFGQVSSVRMPEKVSKELAQFMGILISEGCVNRSYFYLTMKDKEMPLKFIALLKELFGIKANLLFDNARKQYRVAFRSDALVKLLEAIGYNPFLKSGEKEIPSFIMQASNEVVKEFLRAYYEGDGCVSRDCVKVTTKSKKIANNLAYLLLRFGLVARISHENCKTKIGEYKYCRKFYNLRLYGSNLNIFSEKIGFFSEFKNNKLKFLLKSSHGEKTDLIPGMHSMIRTIRKLSGVTHKEFFSEVGMNAHNLENPNNSLMHSRYRLAKISQLLSANNYLIQQLGKIVDSDFYCDFVKKAEKISPKEDYWLYDFSMKKNHSFIAGFGGIISHNTQSALIEAMQEKQVTIGKETFQLPLPFFVMATENPLETGGVYTLPEAQIDRFLFKIIMGYPDIEEEDAIMSKNTTLKKFEEFELKAITNPEKIIKMQELTKKIYLSEKIKKYILRIIELTRTKELEHGEYIEWGASPRATIALFIASKARALMQGRNFVVPGDVKESAYEILRHRIILSYKARVEHFTSDDIIKEILKKVKVP